MVAKADSAIKVPVAMFMDRSNNPCHWEVVVRTLHKVVLVVVEAV